ncbi:MAG TPA: hypothetical protein VMH04_02815 [Candidatus Solibacter sp.]|nr:hypothetical protein [Candidatus Solibacter sp.]
MKTIFVVLLMLCTASCFAQYGSISAQAQPIAIPDHPQHADIHEMAQERPIVGGGTYVVAQGERPLYEFGPVGPPPTPLGDVARAYRKEKQATKKAEIVFEKQGS